MGVASSRVLTSGQDSTSKSLSWHGLRCGMNYSKQDLMLWPQLEPLAHWFTVQDARRLYLRLHSKAGSTGLLTSSEFLQWIDVGDKRPGGLDRGSKASRPEVSDVMTPPLRGNQQHLDCEVATKDPPSILEKHLQHVFLTFADGRGDRLYALEFLAAMVVISRAIWDYNEKMTLLLELFHDPATSSSKALAYASAQRLKETDAARLLLCVMNGSIVSTRSGTNNDPLSNKSVSSEEFRAYVTTTPALHEFLALFSGEELRNPLTFERSAAHFSRQTELYESLLRRYVTFEGREERRRNSAALLIQSTWRRRCSLFDAQRRAEDRVAHRHKSAAQLQGFFKHRRVARELEARAEIERSALNGGVFAAGSGPSGLWLTTRSRATQDGMVYSWGFNDHGQLGHGSADTLAARTSGRVRFASYYDERSGEEEDYLASPTRLLYFEGCAAQQANPIPVAHVCCGDYYCMALSRAGDVFTWGEASEGQLGHGETHEYYQVALADRHMVSSAYTYLAQPEPVLALSDVCIAQIACRGNHSVALSTDETGSRLFEWGNWGRRRGVDSEHAFVPEETVGASALRLRQVAVGDHHMLAEGASVWLKLVTRTNGPVQDGEEEIGFFVLPLAGASSSLEAIEKDFMGKRSTSWVCCLVDLDVDDVDEDSGDDATDTTKETDKGALWHKRAERFFLSLNGLADFDPRSLRLVSASGSANNAASAYSQGVDQWLRGRVASRLVVMPRGKPAGFYVQFRLPNNSDLETNNRDSQVRKSQKTRIPIQRRSFWRGAGAGCVRVQHGKTFRWPSWIYHARVSPAMEATAKRLKQQQLRARSVTKKKPTVAPTEMNSIFVLEIDQSVLTPLASAVAEGIGTESEAELEAETIIGEIGHRVLELQEAGALAVLVVLDLFDADAFALRFSDDSGVFVPVFMVTRQTQAAVIGSYGHEGSVSEPDEGDSTRRTSWTVQEILDHALTSPQRLPHSQALAILHVAPPCSLWFQHFHCSHHRLLWLDSSIAQIQQHISTISFDLLTNAHHEETPICWAHSTRAWGKIAGCISLIYPRDTCTDTLKVAGGTTYAWGGAENGRLGLGEVVVANAGGGESTDTSEVEPPLFQDGYEAFTDATYSFVAQPTRIPILAGVEMKQLLCGSAHSLAVTKHGKVFSWGRAHWELVKLDDLPILRIVLAVHMLHKRVGGGQFCAGAVDVHLHDPDPGHVEVANTRQQCSDGMPLVSRDNLNPTPPVALAVGFTGLDEDDDEEMDETEGGTGSREIWIGSSVIAILIASTVVHAKGRDLSGANQKTQFAEPSLLYHIHVIIATRFLDAAEEAEEDTRRWGCCKYSADRRETAAAEKISDTMLHQTKPPQSLTILPFGRGPGASAEVWARVAVENAQCESRQPTSHSDSSTVIANIFGKFLAKSDSSFAIMSFNHGRADFSEGEDEELMFAFEEQVSPRLHKPEADLTEEKPVVTPVLSSNRKRKTFDLPNAPARVIRPVAKRLKSNAFERSITAPACLMNNLSLHISRDETISELEHEEDKSNAPFRSASINIPDSFQPIHWPGDAAVSRSSGRDRSQSCSSSSSSKSWASGLGLFCRRSLDVSSPLRVRFNDLVLHSSTGSYTGS
ncbi:Regulator of chromosome condensation 1/beta-lactamase-inhibitor protein II [Phytophthora cactorum]|nr:Regulator of chromosome condensation 1/beta-lactamase-inhibitor protein II [Phytophthora cactorum]